MKAAAFWILVVIDAAAGAVVLYFLVDGLANRTVYPGNADLWLLVMVGPAAILVAGFWLKSTDRGWLANAVLAVLALPCLVGAILVAVVTSSPGAFR